MQVVYLSGIGFSTVGLARRSNHQRETWRDTNKISREDLLARHTVQLWSAAAGNKTTANAKPSEVHVVKAPPPSIQSES